MGGRRMESRQPSTEECKLPPNQPWSGRPRAAHSGAARRRVRCGRKQVHGDYMKVRYFIDPTTDVPHIYNHDVSEAEVEDVLAHSEEDRPGLHPGHDPIIESYDNVVIGY